MKAYKDMTREELFAEKEKLEAMYQDYKGQNLALNMSRIAGKALWQQSNCSDR